MPPSSRIPPLLQPYIHLPHEESLILLTSTLGASANWLLIRFLCDALNTSSRPDGGEEEHNVVLVSWMREYEFWKSEARKSAGLDLEKLRKDGRFAFVDGLSGLCLDSVDAPATSSNEVRTHAARTPQSLPVRGPPGRITPARGPPTPTAPPAQQTPTSNVVVDAPQSTPGLYTLKSLDLAHLKSTISTAVTALASNPNTSSPQRKTLIVLDNPDLLLALNGSITASAMTSLILALHTLPTVSHVLTHMQSDSPLLSLSAPAQPLEVAQHNLLVKYAHMSSRIVGVRVLDTGVAQDVSGVLRVTEQKAQWLGLGFEDAENGMNGGDSGKGKEFLYQVKGDGSVRVFERGAGGEN